MPVDMQLPWLQTMFSLYWEVLKALHPFFYTLATPLKTPKYSTECLRAYISSAITVLLVQEIPQAVCQCYEAPTGSAASQGIQCAQCWVCLPLWKGLGHCRTSLQGLMSILRLFAVPVLSPLHWLLEALPHCQH